MGLPLLAINMTSNSCVDRQFAPRKRAVLDLQLEDSAPAQVNDADALERSDLRRACRATDAVQAKRQVARRNQHEKAGTEQSQAS